MIIVASSKSKEMETLIHSMELFHKMYFEKEFPPHFFAPFFYSKQEAISNYFASKGQVCVTFDADGMDQDHFCFISLRMMKNEISLQSFFHFCTW